MVGEKGGRAPVRAVASRGERPERWIYRYVFDFSSEHELWTGRQGCAYGPSASTGRARRPLHPLARFTLGKGRVCRGTPAIPHWRPSRPPCEAQLDEWATARLVVGCAWWKAMRVRWSASCELGGAARGEAVRGEGGADAGTRVFDGNENYCPRGMRARSRVRWLMRAEGLLTYGLPRGGRSAVTSRGPVPRRGTGWRRSGVKGGGAGRFRGHRGGSGRVCGRFSGG